MQGQTQLVQKIMNEINELGHIPFARFMELALYDPEFGYYMVESQQHDSVSVKVGQIGFLGGDFYTAPYLHPLLAKALARQIAEVDEILGYPDEFAVLEMGCGEGLLARDILKSCMGTNPSLFGRLHYIMIDRSPAMVKKQRGCLDLLLNDGARISWENSLEALGRDAMCGVVLSNELVDAFPVHRVRMQESVLQEMHVTHQDGQFVEYWASPPSAGINEWFETVGVPLPEGSVTEVNLEGTTWMTEVGRVLKKGVVLTIDYGHTAADYFAPERKEGCLRCHYQHTVNQNPFQHVGLQDMTAHVNFTSLARAGETAGLLVSGFTDLMHLLMGLGIEEMVSDGDPEAPTTRAAMELLRPNGMGRTFKVLVQHKGLPHPSLSALKHRAFFRDVLMGATA